MESSGDEGCKAGYALEINSANQMYFLEIKGVKRGKLLGIKSKKKAGEDFVDEEKKREERKEKQKIRRRG